MNIKHIQVSSFRGIRELDWTVEGSVACLIGPNDSTKSSIIEAVELVLSPRWNPSLSDADFYQGDTKQPIEIRVVVAGLPQKLMVEEKFGLALQGWTPDGRISGMLEEGCEAVLHIQLRVDESLEPEWQVLTASGESKRISHSDRRLLGMARVGAEVDRHLSWARDSALSRATAGGSGEASSILAGASRAAVEAAGKTMATDLDNAAKQAQKNAELLGLEKLPPFHPALDQDALIGHSGAITLHAEGVPLRQAGLGTRRLVAMGLETFAVPEGAILLLDEVEHGLEPHRVRHLLRGLQLCTDKTKPGSQRLLPGCGQVLMTTHSPIVAEELDASQLYVVRSNSGVTTVNRVDSSLQGTVRHASEALLSRRVIVCEGKTEVGMCRAMEERVWTNNHDGRSLAYAGVSLLDGCGDRAPKYALELARLGYSVALFADSDVDKKSPDIGDTQLEEAGVRVIRWGDQCSTEDRVSADLPADRWKSIVLAAIETRCEESVLGAVNYQLRESGQSTVDADDLKSDQEASKVLRQAVGRAAKTKGWFKTIDLGEQLGCVVAEALPRIESTDLAGRLRELEEWAYG